MRSAWLRAIWVAAAIALTLAPLGSVAPGAASTAGAPKAIDLPGVDRPASSVMSNDIGARAEPQVVDDEGTEPPAEGDPNLPANLRKLAETNTPVRLIVQLVDPPLASYAGGTAGLPSTKPTAGGRVDVQSAPAARYSAFLADRRSAAIGALTAAAPGAIVERQYDTVLNGLAVKTTGANIDRIAQLPGVKRVTVARQYHLDMDASLPVVGLISGTLGSGIDTGLWSAVGGHEHAGEGVKVAIIDSGIYIDNPFFNPAGFTCPPGFPKYDPGFAAYANCKVIVARAYFRPDDPPDPVADGANPIAHATIEHGSHTAGTVAGVYSTTTPYLPAGISPISGVAPRAWLMNYRVFYQGVSGLVTSHDAEMIAAIEDAVRDGADVVNDSWGGPPGTSIADDPLINAYSAAVDAGVVVVFSNGNTGPGQQTTATPAGAEKFISVGATTASRVLTYRLDAVGAGVPFTVTNIAAYPGNGPAVTTTIGPAPYVDSKTATNSTNTLGCSAFSPGLFTGIVALIERGTCNPVIKINNAAAAGAIAVVLINDGNPQIPSGLETTTIPAVVVDRQFGLNLRSWYAANPPSAALQINPGARYNPGSQDAVASFSSRGPNLNFTIKPDVAAPGVNILSAYLGRFEFKNGTSMAGPHVAGAAALLRQIHRDWSPAQIKSALMSTAATPGALSANPMDRGAGRIDLGAAGDPGLTFDQPSLSFGVVAPDTGPMTLTVTTRNVAGSDATYSLSAAQTISNANLAIGVSTPSISVPMSGTTTFQVVLNAGPGTPPTDYFGQVNLTDGVHNLHIPYWVRVVNPAGLNPSRHKVLLIDDDLSNCVATNSACKSTGGFGDYRGIWSQTLSSLGVDFDVWDTNPLSTTVQPVPWDIAQQYGKVVWFTGDSRGHAWYVTGGIGTEPFRYFLSNNGRLIASGQDLVTGLTLSGMTSSTTGQLLGAARLADTLGNTLPARPSLQGDPQAPPVFAGQVYDLSAITTTAGLTPDGAHNQRSIDELQAAGYPENDSLPLFVATGISGTVGSGTVGTLIYSEPSLERLAGETQWSHLGYRTATLGFGLEAVNNNTGYGTREGLLGSLLSWLDDEVTLTGTWLSPTTTVGLGQALMFLAEANSSLEASFGQTVPMQRLRWDFGDGTPIQTSSGVTQTTISHAFQTSGTYLVRVEAVDTYGHRAVRDVALVGVGGSIAVPIGTGWNNVSLPVSRTVRLTASGFVDELDSQGIVVDQVVRWSNGGWQSYLAGFPGGDFPIELGQGYFVRSQNLGTWHAAGIPIRDAPTGAVPGAQTLVATGWNNISLPVSQTTPLTASGLVARLEEQGIATDQIVRWHNGGWQSHIANFQFNDFPIALGQAYFVRSRTFGTWRPTQ